MSDVTSVILICLFSSTIATLAKAEILATKMRCGLLTQNLVTRRYSRCIESELIWARHAAGYVRDHDEYPHFGNIDWRLKLGGKSRSKK